MPAMRPPSVLTDEFLRALVAIGQVDLLVGLPTFNNAATVKPIAQAVYVAFARYFPRLRTALVNSDGGSADGTPEIVQSVTAQASGEPVSTLRTIHRVATSHASALGKGSALRTVFAAADLTQARTVVVLDPDIASVTPEWIERLARPSLERKMDYVAPVYARGPFEGPLVRHIVRPVFQAVYGVPMREPVGGEFACSGRFAAHCLRRSVWNLAFTRYGMDIWLAGEAVAGGFEVAEAALGPRTPMRTSGRLGLAELIAYVVGALFTCLELHEGHWTSDPAPRDLPSFGTLDAVRPDGAPPASEARGDLARDVADLRPILQSCLESETLAALQRAAAGDDAIGDELWARLLGDFMLAHARQSIGRDHLLQALVPLYRDRVAAFVETHRHDGPAAVEAAFERLAAACLRLRPSWIERWHQ
jgi:hypothetical protein